MAVGLFLDIEGAFNCTTVEAICRAAERHGLGVTITRWIRNMLSTRQLTVTRGEGTIRASAGRGCPQGGVISPLLWCLVDDELLDRLSRASIYARGYADDLVVASLAQEALNLVSRWCREVGLNVNPEKTEMVCFTRWRKVEGWSDPKFRGTAIKPTEQVKHLGVILDAKLNWGKHMQRVRDRACALLWATRRACGVTWGLNPKAMHWIYTAVVKPNVLFGAVIWWSRARLKTAKGMLTHVQRPASRGTTSAMKTAPSMALETLMNWPSLYTVVQSAAASSAYMLMSTTQWQGELTQGSHTDIVGILREASPLAFLTRDWDLVG